MGLFELADRFEEVKTICREQDCKSKAMFNVRYRNGKPTFEGDAVKVGDTKAEENKDYYVVKCSTHFTADYVKYGSPEKENVK